MPKKTFLDKIGQPAELFISGAAPEDAAPDPGRDTPPDGYKLDPRYIEKRTRRLQLILQPSLYERVKEQADSSGISVNDYIHQVLEKETKHGRN